MKFATVICLPFFFGTEKTASWIWVRTWDFANLRALETDPIPFMIGDPGGYDVF